MPVPGRAAALGTESERSEPWVEPGAVGPPRALLATPRLGGLVEQLQRVEVVVHEVDTLVAGLHGEAEQGAPTWG